MFTSRHTLLTADVDTCHRTFRSSRRLRPVSLCSLLTALLVTVIVTGCSAPQWRQTSGAAWGTTYSVTYLGDKDLADSVIAEMRRVELAVSMFDPASNVSRVNSGATDTLSEMTAAVFRESQRISALSGGYFDPTVAPLVDLWGFGRKGREGIVPDSADIADALSCVGIADCSLDEATRRITLKSPRTQLDFSAIAKGFGVDCVADMLLRNGCRDFMVEIGGEIVVSGHNPHDGRWRIQIDSPTSGASGHESLRVIEITDCAVATSGNYRNYRQVGGQTVSHTLSPITGRPVQSTTLSVTVIAPRCMTADALATAAMAMPADSARILLRRHATRALLVESTPADTLRVTTLP